MFMGSRMIDDVRLVFFHQSKDFISVLNIGDLRVKEHLFAEACGQLGMYGMNAVLPVAEKDDFPRKKRADLAADLRTD